MLLKNLRRASEQMSGRRGLLLDWEMCEETSPAARRVVLLFIIVHGANAKKGKGGSVE